MSKMENTKSIRVLELEKKMKENDKVVDALEELITEKKEQRNKAKLMKKVLGYDPNWNYSYLASEVKYLQNRVRYYYDKWGQYLDEHMGLTSATF